MARTFSESHGPELHDLLLGHASSTGQIDTSINSKIRNWFPTFLRGCRRRSICQLQSKLAKRQSVCTGEEDVVAPLREVDAEQADYAPTEYPTMELEHQLFCSMPEPPTPGAAAKKDSEASTFEILVSSMPAQTLAHVFTYCGIQSAAQLGPVCTHLHACVWDSTEVWQAFLGSTAINSAAALRNDHRWHCYGIDSLVSWRKRPPSGEHSAALQAACRAIHGLTVSDPPRRVDAVASALTDLLRWFDSTDNEAYEKAKELVKTVAAQSEILTTEHVHELRRALCDSQVLRKSLRHQSSPVSSASFAGAFATLFENDELFRAHESEPTSPMMKSTCDSLASTPTVSDRRPHSDEESSADELSMDRIFSALRQPELGWFEDDDEFTEDDSSMDRIFSALAGTASQSSSPCSASAESFGTLFDVAPEAANGIVGQSCSDPFAFAWESGPSDYEPVGSGTWS